MFCPYCNGEYQIMHDPQICKSCGAKLPSYGELLEQRRVNSQCVVFPEPPVGSYKGAGETLLVREDGVAFSKKDREVPLSELYDVSYYPGKMTRPGFLCIREWKERNIPLVTQSADTLNDDTTIGFYLAEKEKFYKVYSFLRQCVDLNHAANPGWKEDILLPIMGEYKGTYGSMEIGVDSVRFSKKVPFQSRTEREILYKEIAKVVFEEGKNGDRGCLWVREWEERNIPTRKKLYASVDATAIDFTCRYNEKMGQVYKLLQNCVRENEMLRTREAGVQTEQQKPIQQPTSTEVPDLEYYYQRYKPDRMAAIKALRIDSGMSFREAKANADLIFDFHDSKQVTVSNSEFAEEIICCGRCWSTDITAGKREYYAVLGSGLVLRKVDDDRIQFKCNNCGYTWEP